MDNIPSSETGFGNAPINSGVMQDYYNLRGEWSLASFDTPHYLTFNGIYELPFGKNKKFLHTSRLADWFIGGWQLNGITSFTSGTPQEMFTSVNTLYNYNDAQGVQRANWNGKNPSIGGKVSSRLNNYFNVNDFSDPAPFTYGNSPRDLGNLRSPNSSPQTSLGLRRSPSTIVFQRSSGQKHSICLITRSSGLLIQHWMMALQASSIHSSTTLGRYNWPPKLFGEARYFSLDPKPICV